MKNVLAVFYLLEFLCVFLILFKSPSVQQRHKNDLIFNLRNNKLERNGFLFYFRKKKYFPVQGTKEGWSETLPEQKPKIYRKSERSFIRFHF